MTNVDKRTLPRTVRGAKKKGWTVVYFPRNLVTPWFGFTNLVRRQATGTTVNVYSGHGGGHVLFENSSDAMFAMLKFGGEFR